jgi:hypothetical protein
MITDPPRGLPVVEERLTFIQFICECGQYETVRIEAESYKDCYDGPVQRDWEEHACPYQYDPRCIACRRHKRPTIQAFSGRSRGPDAPERAVDS